MTEILSKLKQELTTEIEHRIQFIIEDSDGELTHAEAEERACEAILDQADELSCYSFFEFLLADMGYVQTKKDNPYNIFKEQPKDNIIYPFGIDMDMDMSFLNIR